MARSVREWHPVAVIEYGYVAPDPLHPEIVFGAGRSEVSKYDMTTGQVQNVTPIPVRSAAYRSDRTEPILFRLLMHMIFTTPRMCCSKRRTRQDVADDKPDLSGNTPPSQRRFKPFQRRKWQGGVVSSIRWRHRLSQSIRCGRHDDGLLWVTRDHGKNWKNISPKGLTPWSKITQISASHFSDTTAYVSVSRMRIDDLHPYLFRTHDGALRGRA